MNETIREDIENWSEERLHLWVKDTVSRFEMADASQQEAYSLTVITMMFVLAKLIASSTTPSHEAGERMMMAVDMIREIRHNEKKKEA